MAKIYTFGALAKLNLVIVGAYQPLMESRALQKDRRHLLEIFSMLLFIISLSIIKIIILATLTWYVRSFFLLWTMSYCWHNSELLKYGPHFWMVWKLIHLVILLPMHLYLILNGDSKCFKAYMKSIIPIHIIFSLEHFPSQNHVEDL